MVLVKKMVYKQDFGLTGVHCVPEEVRIIGKSPRVRTKTRTARRRRTSRRSQAVAFDFGISVKV